MNNPTDEGSAQRKASAHEAPSRPICFRITGVASHWGEPELKEKLSVIDPDLDFRSAELSLFPACSHLAKTKTALLRLGKGTLYFEGWEQDKEVHLRFQENGRTVRLCIDKHFRGLTPLNNPGKPEAINIRADIVAITGLAGHAFGSWQSRATHAMWLYDYLPEHFEDTRIMTYGYNSSLLTPNSLRLTDHRKHFTQELQNARAGFPKRPIIFIAHSLGGILVTQTLLGSFRSTASLTRDLFNSTRGITFFGTPHQGLDVEDFKVIVEMHTEKEIDVHDLPQLLGQLKNDSEFLGNHEEECRSMWENFRGRICSFYETEKTNTLLRVGDTIQRNGPRIQKVFRFSAQLHIQQEISFPVDSDHTDMVKFAVAGKEFYTVVLLIHEWLDRAAGEEHLLQLFSHSVKVIDSYYGDQNNYIDTHSEAREFEHDGRYFWIFRNMDYEKWSSLEENANVLVLRGGNPHILEEAACHVTRTLQNTGNETSNLPLFFFHGSIYGRPFGKKSDWPNLFAVCNILKQILDNDRLPQRQLLLESFWKEILQGITKEDLVKLPTSPTDCGKHLLEMSSTERLWNALGQALCKAAELNTRRCTQDLTLVLDFDGADLEPTIALIDNSRRIKKILLKYYRTMRVLVTNPPKTGDLKLEQSSEVLLEYDRERQACLKTLRFNNTRYGRIDKQYEHTYEWLLDHPMFLSWNSSKRSSFLFIEGKPGSGKSTLVRYFADQLQSRADAKGAIIVKFFYSYRDGELERDHRNMLLSLLYGILSADESFFIHFQPAFRKLAEAWPYQTLKDILRGCIGHPLERRVFLIIDAMDESDDTQRADIVQFLLNLSVPNRKKIMVKVFLASRPLSELHLDSLQRSHRILLQAENRRDIERYTRGMLQNSVFKNIKDIIRDIESFIVNNAEGVFQWVCLVGYELVRFLAKGSTRAKVLKFLQSLPKDLERYYERILDELNKHDDDDIEDGRRILQFCLFSHRAIRLSELAHALAISSAMQAPLLDWSSWESESSTSISRRLTYCAGGFIEIKYGHNPVDHEDSAIVQVMHHTVREFFLRPHDAVPSSNFKEVIDIKHGWMMIQKSCVGYLYAHFKELLNFFPHLMGHQSLEVHSSASNDSQDLVKYLESRPFIKYSLELLTRPETNIHPGIQQFFSALTASIEDRPSTPFCHLKRLTGVSKDEDVVQLNHLLGFAAESGYAIAVANLLAGGADCESRTWGEVPLHRAIQNGHDTVVEVLLDHGANIEARDDDQWTPLHRAASKGHTSIVELLLDRGANTEAKDDCQWMPLHRAVLEGHTSIVELLLDHGADIEARDYGKSTPLLCAASRGYELTCKLLLDRGANIGVRDGRNLTPLHHAAWGHASIGELLLDRGANIEARDSNNLMALHHEASEGHTSIVELLLARGANTEAKDDGQRTPLHRAALEGHTSIVELLLDRGANVEARDDGHWTPLHRAASRGYELACKLLLDHSADIEARDYGKSTPLLCAASRGYESACRLLLDRGANIEARDSNNLTALHHEAREGHASMIELLLDRGADIEAKGAGYWTPLHRAASWGHASIVELLLDRGANIEARDSNNLTALHHEAWEGHASMIELLLDRGADIEATDAGYWTSLHGAASEGLTSIVELLLDRGANTEAKDDCQWTPLHRAVLEGHTSIVELLLDHGANIEATDANYWTPLHRVVYKGHESTCRLLLDHGADTEARSSHERTPLHYAARYGYEPICKLLLEHGANIEARDYARRTALQYAASKSYGSESYQSVVRLFEDSILSQYSSLK